MIIGDIVRKEESNDGKAYWHKLGTLFEKDGKYSVKVAGVWFNVYPPKDKDDSQTGEKKESKFKKVIEEMDIQDIPF